jgi:hypothetical protein
MNKYSFIGVFGVVFGVDSIPNPSPSTTYSHSVKRYVPKNAHPFKK